MPSGIEYLLINTSRAVANQVYGIAIQKPEVINELMELSISQKGQMALRASNILTLVAESKPELILPYIDQIVRFFPHLQHISVKRAFTKIISKYPDINDDDLLSILVYHCFEWLNDADETVAIRVYSMNILANICKIYPELIPELKQTIELHYDDGSAGFKSRAIKILENFNS